MPATMRLLVEPRLVLFKGWGVLTGDELLEQQRRMLAHPSFDATTTRQIVDMREVTEIQLDGATMRLVAARQPFRPEVRRVIVVGSDEGFGLARMYQLLREGPGDGLRVFRDLDEALDYMELGVCRDPVAAELTGMGSPD